MSNDDGHETQDERALALIEEQADRTIRRVLHDNRLFFSVIDVVGLLTDSNAPRKYWYAMRKRITDEGFRDASTKCRRMLMRSRDGVERETDAADTETLLRIIQSIPSHKAEPIKQWLAKVGAEKLQEVTAQPLPPVAASQEIAELRRNKPDEDAPSLVWADYLERLASLYRRQGQFEMQMREMQAQMQYVDAKLDEHDDQLNEHEEQIGELHSRMEGNEALLRMVPELLERLGPETLSPEHQQTVRALAKRLNDVSGQSFASIYTKLGEHFHVARYQQLPEARWFEIMQWFQQQIAAGKR
jgi:hypothetical protein